MAQQVINLGATGSGAGGDSARTAFEKAIANFAELYIAALPGTAAQKQAARDMFGLGTAATKAAQSSATDPTPGALVGVKGFGLGGAIGWPDASSLDDLPAGFYASLNSLGGPSYASTRAAVISSYDVGSTYGAEIHLDRGNNGRIAFRVKSGGWLSWRELFHAANILGTVSQSSGVPTGAIIERGSNANGEYVRFADGTQICTGRIAIDLSNASAQNINWPATFTSMVPFSLAIDSSPGLSSSTIYDAFQSIALMTDSSVRGRVVVRTTAPYTVQCLFVAVGRWY
jgi:hypothetical protein